MIKHILTCTLGILLLASCQTETNVIKKIWLNQPIDFSQVREVTNTYHMMDSTGTKVGSMIFGFSFENGLLVARDTSQFDDGSVYETAIFTFDTSAFRLSKVSIDLATPAAKVAIALELDTKVTGTYQLTRDTVTSTFPIDSAYQHQVVRSELYMLFHTLQLTPGDSLSFNALAPTSMAVSAATLTYAGTDRVETPVGAFDCDVLWLRTDGIMPSNKIWISKTTPRKVVKFYVPGPELELNLVSSK